MSEHNWSGFGKMEQCFRCGKPRNYIADGQCDAAMRERLFSPAYIAEADAEQARKDNELLRRGDVIAMLKRMEDADVDLALTGEPTNARNRESAANAMRYAALGVALLTSADAGEK